MGQEKNNSIDANPFSLSLLPLSEQTFCIKEPDPVRIKSTPLRDEQGAMAGQMVMILNGERDKGVVQEEFTFEPEIIANKAGIYPVLQQEVQSAGLFLGGSVHPVKCRLAAPAQNLYPFIICSSALIYNSFWSICNCCAGI